MEEIQNEPIREEEITEEEPKLSPHELLAVAVAENIATLRASRKMTQMELGEALNYSDKAISKWERGEAVPDAYVLSDMAAIFDVSVDWILTKHEKTEEPPRKADRVAHIRFHITLLSFIGLWTLATIVFVTLAIVDIYEWQVFIYTIPLSLILLIVFNALWGGYRRCFLLVALLVASLLVTLYVIFLERNLWMLFILAAPAEICVLATYLLVNKKLSA